MGAVYTFGFILMCPQLYLNYKLKSVAHLPWRQMTYKFLNTIIDDLFAFVIKMPLLHRLSGECGLGCREGWGQAAALLSLQPPPAAHIPAHMPATYLLRSVSRRCDLCDLPVPALDLPGRPQARQRVRVRRGALSQGAVGRCAGRHGTLLGVCGALRA